MKKKEKLVERPALITIRGEQDELDWNGSTDVMEFVTAGSFAYKDGGCQIRYMESELTGMEGTETRLRAEGGRVTVERTGQVSAQMIFEPGKRHVSAYATSSGTMLIGVSASAVRMDFDESGGSLSVDYSVEIDHALTGYNRFSMQVSMIGS